MRKCLVNQQCLTRKLLLLSLLCAMTLVPKCAWAQNNIEYYGITVGGVEVTSENAMGVTGDNITNGMVSYSAQDNTLTLNGATISSGGITCQDNLRLSIIGSVTVNGNITSSKQNGATLTLLHGDDLAADFTYNPASSDASGFTSVVYDGMYLTPAVYNNSQLIEGNRRDVKYSPSRQRFEESQWSSLSTVKFTSAKNYELWLGGTKVTEANKDDILGDKVPHATFNPSDNTLTLNGMTLTSTWIYDSGIISRLPNLKIVVNGENIITCSNDSCTAIRADMEGAQTLTIENGDNDGSLTFTASHAIRDFNSLTLTGLHWVDGNNYAFENATTSSNYGSHTGTQVVDKSGDSPVEVGNATLSSKYSLKVGGVDVTDANASNITGNNITTGTVSFNASTNTLTLNGATLTEPIIVGMPNLTIDIQGNNTITTNTTCIQKLNDNTNPSLTFKSTSDEVGSLILKNTDEDNYGGVNKINNVSFSKELALIMYRYGSYTSNTDYFTAGEVYNAQIVPSYGVKVGDLFVYEGNFNDVLGDGKVSFDQANHTLTLNNVNIGYSSSGSISTSLPELIIEVIGNNTLTSDSYSTLQSLYGDDVTMTVQSSGTIKGCLVLKMSASSNNVFAGDHVTLNITSPLEVVSGNLNVNDGNLNVVTIGEPVGYELLVEDVKVVAANASNITNSISNSTGRPVASFDVATNTLTLDNSYFYYYIYGSKVPVQSDIQDLKVKLVGVNEVTLGSKVFKYTGPVSESAPKLTFATEMVDDAYGSLKINGTTSTEDIADGYQITNTLLPADANQGTTGWLYSVGNYFSLWYQEAYGITVKKDDRTVSVTNANRIDVLGDADPNNNKPATVQFDGRRRLVLNGAELTSIVVSATNNLPETGLDIYLKGHSTITNATDYAISSEGSTARVKLAFHTDSDTPGTLVCTNGSDIGANSPFLGFDTKYYNNLAQFTDNNKVTVKTSLGLIVGVNGTTNIDYSSNPGGSDGAKLDNVSYGNVLYTLDDDGTQVAPDGYDQNLKAIVVNSVMTDEQVRNIDTDVIIPGTPEYQELFKGLTYIVPAGTGTITLNGVKTITGYAFHVMVGNQDPMEVVNTGEPADYVLSYACGEASYVKLYLVNLATDPNGAPAKKVDHRIGPKSSVGGALGGVKVSNSSVQSTADPAAPYKAMKKAMMATDLTKLSDPYNGYTCNDQDITDLADNLCVANTSAPAINPAPRRGGASSTILPEGLTYLDFSETKITGMEISRTSGPFNGVPENVFIYMPAGNTTKDKNVVIGGICDVAELDGSSYAQPFKAKKDFKAGQATLKRTFEAGSTDSKATIYLPYNIAQEDANKLGTFYAYTGNDGTTVTMNKVTTGGLKANKPYIFEAKEGGVQNPMVHGVDIVANPAETEGFKGVYKRKNYESGMYCYAGEEKGGKYTIGQFVEMGPGSYVPPFRAYMIGNGAPSYAIAWDGEVDIVQNEENTTAVETVKTDNNVKTQDGWWTINGMRLKAQPKKAGLYILNGRMVVVK